jgi:HAE1 family hydrophobic/amphiphilic exporter-1
VLPPLTANLRTSVQPVAAIGGGGAQNADVQFLISGPDLKTLERSGAARGKDQGAAGLVDVDSSLNVGKPELSSDRSAEGRRRGRADWRRRRSAALLVGGDQVTTYNEAANSTRCTCAPAPKTARPSRPSRR